MLDTLRSFLEVSGDKDLIACSIAMVVSTLAGVVCTCLYDYFYESRATGSQIQRSFLLMAPSVTLLFITVQLSLPLSLGLLGALSIVRFRVPVKEPEEVAFLMVVIASSITCATFNYTLLLGLMAVVVVALFLRSLLADKGPVPKRANGMLVVTVPRDAYHEQGEKIEALLQDRLGRLRLEHMHGENGTTQIHYGFHASSGIAWPRIESDLSALCPRATLSVMMSRAGGL